MISLTLPWKELVSFKLSKCNSTLGTHIAALRDGDLAIAWYLVPVNDLEWDPLNGIGRKSYPSMPIVSLNLRPSLAIVRPNHP